ncbi:MAG TPA: hypothetical protein VM759_02780 [Longimicrobium sp.]|nr:hypothetical protein [Longimicrobium sp.]
MDRPGRRLSPVPLHQVPPLELAAEELILTIDGQEHERLVPGQKIVARRAEQPVRLVRFPGQTFFSTLRRKLKWGDLMERDGG